MAILKDDPSLEKEENKILKHTYHQIGKYKNIWNYIS
jgi:ATP-dependent DNA helicase RecG